MTARTTTPTNTPFDTSPGIPGCWGVAELEKDIEGACVDLAESLGWFAYKMDRSRSKRGWPDQLFLGPAGQHFFVEFKRPGQHTSAHQARRLAQLQECEHAVFVVTSITAFTQHLSNASRGSVIP